MSCNQLFSSFMILSEYLYEKFAHYILNGRTRAPPETELIEMLPTFQFGAKTDRRAVQSKFKSWARRMNFENGSLVLKKTKKIIVPKENCDHLIMTIHSAEHHEVENVIYQIRKTYTWTRKNFGMDTDVVVGSILRNCKREECIKKMRLEIAKFGNSFCSGMPNFSVPDVITGMPFGMPPPLPYFPQFHYPLPLPIPPIFSPNAFPFHVPFLNDMQTPENSKTTTNEAKTLLLSKKEDPPKQKPITEIDGKLKEVPVSQNPSPFLDFTEKVIPAKFNKPRNVYEYKILMEAARKHPKAFPKILGCEKNQFLSSLGIAPKVICSARTLKKFRKELRHKKLMNRECMINRERKSLRDRNKLHKCWLQKKQCTYLGISKKSTRSEAENSTNKHSRSFTAAEKFVCEKEDKCSDTKRIKLSGYEKKEPIKVITIDSSDDENARKDAFLPKETQGGLFMQDEKTSLKQSHSSNQPLEETISQSRSTLSEVKSLDGHDSKNMQKRTVIEYSANLDYDEESSKHGAGDKDYETESNRNKSALSHKLQKAIVNKNCILLPKSFNNSASNELPSVSNNLPKGKKFPVSQFAILQPRKMNTVAIDSTSYLLPQVNPTPIVVRKATPLLSQLSTTFAVSGQSNIARIMYPVNLANTTTSKVVLIDSEQKGAYFVAPMHSKLESVPQNNPRIQPQVISNSKAASTATPINSSQVHDIKSKAAGNEIIRKYKKRFTMDDSPKIDINQEMMRITAWIYRMKSILNPCMLNNGAEKSVQKLLSQLDFGIHLVREAKKSLKEVKNIIDVSKSSTEVAE